VSDRLGRPGAIKKTEKNTRISLIFVAGYVSLLSVTQEAIIRKRDQLLKQLPEARDILRGTLLERNIRHSAGRCKRCDEGDGHPVSVLTIGHPGGRMQQVSLRKEQAAHVKQCLENYYNLRAALEEICELNRQLLRAKPAMGKPAAAKKTKGSGK
jgi:hypothetical protein